MQELLAQPNKNIPTEIRVGANECRLAKQGERLVARGVLADVVVTIQVPAGGFAAMLRFSVPEEKTRFASAPGSALGFCRSGPWPVVSQYPFHGVPD